MGVVYSQNALETYGALYVTINFKVVEVKNKTFTNNGNTSYVFNVKKHKKEMLKNAMYNAVKREFPNRTVTPYDIKILDYHFTYFIDNYSTNDKKITYSNNNGDNKEQSINSGLIKEKEYIAIPEYETELD